MSSKLTLSKVNEQDLNKAKQSKTLNYRKLTTMFTKLNLYNLCYIKFENTKIKLSSELLANKRKKVRFNCKLF